jgi:hypothetical protein
VSRLFRESKTMKKSTRVRPRVKVELEAAVEVCAARRREGEKDVWTLSGAARAVVCAYLCEVYLHDAGIGARLKHLRGRSEISVPAGMVQALVPLGTELGGYADEFLGAWERLTPQEGGEWPRLVEFSTNLPHLAMDLLKLAATDRQDMLVLDERPTIPVRRQLQEANGMNEMICCALRWFLDTRVRPRVQVSFERREEGEVPAGV